MSWRAGWHGWRRVFGALLIGLLLCSWAGRAAATQPQPEAANSPVVRKPAIPVSFLVHNAGWIDLLYPPSARDRVGALIAHAEEARAELAEVLGQPPLQGIEVRIARNSAEMNSLSPVELPPSESALVVVYPSIRLLVLTLQGVETSTPTPTDLLVVFRRELARFAMREAIGPNKAPEWFENGFADRFSGPSTWESEATLLWAAIRHRFVPLLVDRSPADPAWVVDSRRTLLTAEAADFVDFLLAPSRHTRFPTCVDALHRGEALSAALHEAYSSDVLVLELSWRRQVARRAAVTASVLATSVPILSIAVMLGIRRYRRRKNCPTTAEAAPRHPRPARNQSSERRRVHIVLTRRGEEVDIGNVAQSEVPKIEHEGEWHTLH